MGASKWPQPFLIVAGEPPSPASLARMALRNEREQGKKISVYGASTKGNTLLQVFSLDHTLIRSAAERNSEKWGKYTGATLA